MLDSQPISFRHFLSDLYAKRQTVCLKPTNTDQAFVMLSGLLESLKDSLNKGGYVFASRSSASDTINILSSLKIPYEIHSIDKVGEMDLVEFSAIAGAKKVFVFVEPATAFDSAPVWKNFKGMYLARAEQETALSYRTPFIFVNSAMKRPRGMAVLYAQCRSFFSINIIDSVTTTDMEIALALGEEIQVREEAHSLRANSVTIQGGGRGAIESTLKIWMPDGSEKLEHLHLPEENLALVIGLFQAPFTVSLIKEAA